MSNFTDEDYIKIGRLLRYISDNNDEEAIRELHSMFQPLINKYSYNLNTNTFSVALNNEADSKMLKMIMDFKIQHHTFKY